MINKSFRLMQIAVEQQRIQWAMNKISEDYRHNKPYALEEMRRLQEQYNKLYREKQELNK